MNGRRFLYVSIGLVISLVHQGFGQTTAPVERSSDVILADIDSAHHQFTSAVSDPADISDPVRRAAIAPRAIPPLKTMIADYKELAIVQPKMQRRAWQIQQQFDAFLSVLGDQETIDQLQKSAGSKDLNESLSAQCSQVLAKWVMAGKNQDAQIQIADTVRTLDRDHADSEPLTFLTVTMSQSTLSSPLQHRLLQQAREMQNPLAANVRKVTTTQP